MPRGSPRLRTSENKLNQIGARVRERRDALDLKQDELCGRVALATGGVWSPAWQDLSRIENGARIVSDLELLALAEAFECSACWLLTGISEPNPSPNP
ncbi:MAG: hypothetical protein JWN14_2642 [Chthonomonadales bacterium]|nr:hypothetical protein [Chthonomonadales bacterium]